MELGLSGLASGFDWRSLIEQLNEVERTPQRRLRSEQTDLDLRKNAYSSVATQLGVLKNRVDALKDPLLFESRNAKSNNESVATASASAGALLGSHVFDITQLATPSVLKGTADIGNSISASNDVSGVVLSQTSLALSITPGTFTVDGRQISIVITDSLQSVFNKISMATGGSVTATYESATDKIMLSSPSEIVLGSATDSSNFLQAMRLGNNGTGVISSVTSLGTANLSATLEHANLGSVINDGGSGAGEFIINGASISYNAATDTLSDIINRINGAATGVVASYDKVSDRFLLTNEVTGDLGISLEDTTGNFLSATRLIGGTLQRGTNLTYTVGNGDPLTSQSNIISESSSSIAGLSVTALQTGKFTISIETNVDKIKSAITGFIEEYNKSQIIIDSETSSSTDAEGIVTAGDLAGEIEANQLGSKLRQLANFSVGNVAEAIRNLNSLGINSNGTDDTISITDQSAFDNALANDLGSIKNLFTNQTDGLAVQLNSYLQQAVGEEGLLISKQDNLTRQIADIDTQIAGLERLVVANEERLIQSFLGMELAQSKINQQLQFLADRFGGTTS